MEGDRVWISREEYEAMKQENALLLEFKRIAMQVAPEDTTAFFEKLYERESI